VKTKESSRASRGPELSSREREVLFLLCEGSTNKQMAEALNLSTRTIEAYRAKLMRKLGLRSLPELVRYAVRSGIVSA
jgi:two-component system response regulator NreC